MVTLHFCWQCCQALATAVCPANEPPKCIVPRILFLESYLCCEDKSNWTWPRGVKMHVLGSLILQTVFKCLSVCELSHLFCIWLLFFPLGWFVFSSITLLVAIIIWHLIILGFLCLLFVLGVMKFSFFLLTINFISYNEKTCWALSDGIGDESWWNHGNENLKKIFNWKEFNHPVVSCVLLTESVGCLLHILWHTVCCVIAIKNLKVHTMSCKLWLLVALISVVHSPGIN